MPGLTHGLRMPNEAFFQWNFGLGQTNWADKFSVIWGIFGQTISTHCATLSPLSMFSTIQPLFLQKTQAFISKSQLFILNLGFKELGIFNLKPLCFRSPRPYSCQFNKMWCNILEMEENISWCTKTKCYSTKYFHPLWLHVSTIFS